MQKEMTMVRIYLREADHGRHNGLLQEIMSILHDEHRVHGVTVLRGIAGFGRHGEIHSADLLRLNVHLPLVIEFFDEPEIIDAAITALGDLAPNGHLLRWTVLCECGSDTSSG
jgi:PII-like signaling protein